MDTKISSKLLEKRRQITCNLLVIIPARDNKYIQNAKGKRFD
jgi:hypothetical protein